MAPSIRLVTRPAVALALLFVPLGVGLGWRINKMFRIRLEAGAMLEQKFTIIDESNDKFDVTSLDSPAPFASIQLRARF